MHYCSFCCNLICTPQIESQNTTCIDLGLVDSLTVAEHLEIQFTQDRQIQSEQITYKARFSRVYIQKKRADFL